MWVDRSNLAVMQDGAAFRKLLFDLSARFSGVAADQVDAEVERALRAVVEFFGTDRSSFIEISPESGAVAITHSWARPGVKPAVPGTRTDAFTWYWERLRRGDTHRFERMYDELPVDALLERKYVVDLPMLSHLAVPLLVGGQFVCALLTATATSHRTWADIDVECLQIIGEILANAIHRRRLEQDLCQSLSEVRLLQSRLEAENRYLREAISADTGFDGIVSKSPAMREVLEFAAARRAHAARRCC